MKKFYLLLLTLLCIVSITFGQSANYNSPKIEQALREELTRSSNPDQLHRIIVVMDAQYDQTTMERRTSFMNKSNRRSFVINEMQRFTRDSQSDVLEVMRNQKANSVKNLNSFWVFNGFSCEATADVIEMLAGRNDVKIICSDQLQQMIPEPNESEPAPKPIRSKDGRPTNAWNVTKVNADDVWVYNGDTGYTGNGIVVAVIDSGVNYNHTDIANNMWDGGTEYPNHGYDWVNSDNDPMDDHSHGTHCAGTVAGYGTNGTQTGIAKGAKIMALKTLSGSGTGYNSDTCLAIQFAIEHGADILSMSLGTSGSGGFYYYRDAMITVNNAGMVASVAASNDGQKLDQYPIPYNIGAPGNCPPPYLHPDQANVLPGGTSAVICIGATTQSDAHSSFTSVGPATWAAGDGIGSYNDYPYTPGSSTEIGLIRPDVAAPGSSITSLTHDSNTGYCVKSGTSMATPCAAGVMALMLEADPSLLARDIDSILEYTAVRCEGATTKSNYTGSGRIDAYAAIQAVLGGCDAPTNLTTTQVGSTVTLTWTPATSITAYKVFRNGAEIAQVTNANYTDTDLGYGYYQYYVKSVCDDQSTSVASNIAAVTIVYEGPVVNDLAGTVNEDDVTLSWTAPATGTMSLSYTTDFSSYWGYGNNTLFYWGQKYTPEMLSAYAGMAVYKINVYISEANVEYTMKLYQGNETTADQLLATKTFTPTATGVYEVNFETPQYINTLETLWVTLSAIADYPAATAAYDGEAGYAFFYGNNGVSWYEWNGYSSCIETFFTTGTYTFNVLRDNTAIANDLANTTYVDQNVTAGTYNYNVTTNYLGGVSEKSNTVQVTVESANTPITIAEARALENNQYALVQGVVTFIDGRNIYVQDETAGIDLYLNNNTVPSDLALGDMVLAYGKKAVYNGLVELTGINGGVADQFSIVSNGNELPVAVKTIAEILADHAATKMLQSTRVQIVDATIGAINNNGNTAITQENSSLNIYKMPAVEGLVEGSTVTVTGIIGCYNNPQLRVALAADVTYTLPASHTVTFNPGNGTCETTTLTGASVVLPTATPSAACTEDGYTFAGWAEAFVAETTTAPTLFLAGSTYNLTGDITLYAVYKVTESGDRDDSYVKVTADQEDWTGDYLLVYEGTENAYAWTGLDAGNCTQDVTITDGTITGSDFVYLTVAAMEGGYSIMVNGSDNNGKYIYGQSGSNTIKFGNDPALNTLEYDNDNGAKITSYTSVMRFNNASNQMRFRYFKAASYSTQQPVQLYKKNGGGGGGSITYYATSPDCGEPVITYYTVSVAAEILNGTITATPSEAAEGATITVTATPASGYELATLTYTYGETTNNIDQTTMQFTMPAADVVVNGTFTETTVNPITIAEARALENNQSALVQGVVTFIDGRNIYIQDTTAGICLFLNNNTVPATLALGDMVLANGSKTVYKGLVELQGIDGNNADQFSIVSNGNELPVAVKTIAEINADYAATNMLQSTRVQIVEATIGTINNAGNTPITQEGSTLNLYKMPVVEGLLENDIVTVTGIIGCYNAPQVRIASAADVTFEHPQFETVATPTFVPGAGTYYEAQNVTITCETAGATIYYTLDGTDPTANSTVYTTPIAIAETTTVKAFAVKEGMLDSEIATAEFVITEAPTATDYTLITHNIALVPGSKYLVVSVKNDTLYKALGKQKTNNRDGADVTIVNNVISVIPSTSNDGGVFELTLGQDSVGYWTLYDAVNGGYLYAASSSSNWLKVQETNDANGQWTINVASDGVATITAQGANTRNLLRYNGYQNNSLFSCYESGQTEVYLYKAGEVPQPTYYAVNIAEGITNGTVVVSAASAPEGATITVTATPASGYELGTLTYTYGTETIDIDQTTMQFVMPAADVTVNATFTIQETVTTPTFTPEAGTYYEAQNVTIACTTEGATIHYTLDGTDPTTASAVYTEAIVIAETTTVKAMAVKAGMNNSEIATAVYTITDGPTPITIAEARALANNEYALVQGVVTFIDGRNIYIQDATAGIDLFLNNNTVPEALALGDMVLAYGKKSVYNGLVELTAINGSNPDEFSIVSNGNELPVAVKTIAEILADAAGTNMLQSTRVQIVGATIGAINNNNNTPITQDNSTINIYKLPVVEGLLENDIVTVTGVVGCFNNPQLRVALASDVTFEHPSGPALTVAPTTLAGFGYYVDNGPSAQQSLNISGFNLTENVTVTLPGTEFEMSLTSGDDFNAAASIVLTPEAGVVNQTIYVRLAAGLAEGAYTGTITVDSQLDDITVSLSGSVMEAGDSWNRIYSAADLHDGDQVIIAARYDATIADGYYAMTASVTGKPEGVLFTSVTENDVEMLPTEIANNAPTFMWNVVRSGNIISLVNAAGDTLGYGSSTNFAGNVNTTWYFTNETSGANAMVPNYSGFFIYNENPTTRAIALNSSHNYGAYSTSNTNNSDYNFYVDMFVQGGSGTLTVATPIFSMQAGTYFNPIDVEIMCVTEGATIYYTLDGTDPTTSSSVYSSAIHIGETKTLKAIGMKEGFANSNIATAEYVIEEAPSIITIAAAKLLALNEYAMVQGVVTFVDGRNVYIQDETAGIVLYLNANTVPEDLAAGDMVVAYGKRSTYNGLIELNDINGSDPDKFNILSSGNTLPLATVTIAEILEDYAEDNMLQSTRVEIVESTIGAINNNGNTPITQDGSEINIYKMPVVEGLVEGDIVTIIGVIGCYNNPQMRIASADDVEFYHPGGDPTLTVSTDALSGFTYPYSHGPSAAQTFTVSGENLPPAPGGISGGVTIECNNSHYEFSLDGTEYWHNLSIEVVGALEPTTVYVRLEAGLPVGSYIGTIYCEDGGVEASVEVSGTVTQNTGIDETLASNVSVWNNVNEMMFDNGSDKVLDVVVYNMVGQPVLSETIASGNSIIRHDLAEGVYIVRLCNGKEMTSVKVIVRR